MTYRLAKKRALQKSGFVHVAGWVQVKDAANVRSLIDAAKPLAEEALAKLCQDA